MTVFVVLMFYMVGRQLDMCLIVWNLQFTRKKEWSLFFCLHFGDRIINCSGRSAIVLCLLLSVTQSKTITPALSDQLSFPFDTSNFVSWLFLLVFTVVCLFVGIPCLLVDPVPSITRLSFTPTTYLDLVGAKSVFLRMLICNLLCIVLQ